MRNKNFPLLTKEILEYEYSKHKTLKGVADALSISIDSVSKYMKLYNIRYNKTYKGIYSCFEDFFHQDSEISFYLAGFIAADGSVQYRKHSHILKIGLSQKDSEFLYKIKEKIGSTHPIKFYQANNSVEIQIASKELCKGLQRFNIIPNKTFTYTFPEWLTDHPLKHHFMRGYFDGDGSFSIRLQPNRYVPQAQFNLRGTEKFLNIYSRIISNECDINNKNNRVKKYDSTFSISYFGNNLLSKITNFLYKDASFYLERKQAKVAHLFDPINFVKL